ncbi:MAG: sulfotransferase domain-containing protein [Desulfobacteraceae bacterium]|jgi:hypothetical protein|nr:sulfotransferase domain-containing protein [Desulfobacteraceae bacterium]
MTNTPSLTRPTSLKEWLERSKQVLRPVVAKSTKHGLAYEAQPTDLFISPYAKCGTTWLQQIVHGLRTHGSMEFDKIMQAIPRLEFAQWLEIDLYAPQAGNFKVFKCHYNYQEIPKGGRYIVSFRDPKDALVSIYHFLNGHQWEAGLVSISEFARVFYLKYQGNRWENSYWGHLVSWWEQRQNPKVLLLCYEAMKANLPGAVQAIAEFIGVEQDQSLLELVVKQASLDFMLAHKSKFSPSMPEKAMEKIGFTPTSDTLVTVRTGRVGDHRAELPDDIAAEMDAIWSETVKVRTGFSSYQTLCERLA